LLEPLVDVERDTGRFVKALEDAGPGKKLFGVSDLVGGDEYMRTWCEELGQRGGYKQLSIEELIQGIENKDFAREAAESRANQAEFGWLGGEENVLMPKDVSVNCDG